MPLRDREQGFSAIEMIIVVAIIFVLAAITLPNIVNAYRSYTLNIAAEALSQQLNRCRQEAVRENQPVSIKVEAQSTTINLNDRSTYDDDTAVTTSADATTTVISPDGGIVTFTSRGEMVIGVNPSFEVTYSGIKRVVSIDPRGAVTIGSEVAV